MPEDPLKSFQTAVNCYLAILQAVAETLDLACPPVGGPYRQRISRLRGRLAFDTNAAAIEESRAIVETELAGYARRTALYIDRHGAELRRGLGALEEILGKLTQRQDFYGMRLQQFAQQMETVVYPASPEHLAEVVALQAAGLRNCVESMMNESQPLAAGLGEQLQHLERRITEAAIANPASGLTTRRELELRIEELMSDQRPPTLLRFVFSCDLPGEVGRQVGSRLAEQFRHNDLIARWNEREFVVLFQGSPETGCARASQVLPWIAGRYGRDGGGTLDLAVEVRLMDPAEIADPEILQTR